MRGLLSRLGGREEAGGWREPDARESIAEHLRVLLNTRKGDAATAPGFGVVDFSDLVHHFPAAIQALQQSLRSTILEFEPRLKSVTVRHVPGEDPLVLRFDISGQLAEQAGQGMLRLQTVMTPGGQFEVR